MILVCQKCDARLQVDEAKVPAGPFVIRCPKCNASVESTGAASTADVNGVNGSASEDYHFEQPQPAPLFEPEGATAESSTGAAPADRLAEVLSGLITQQGAGRHNQNMSRPSWDPRKALVCVTEELRDAVARGLADSGYKVFVAQDTRQAVDRMREDLMDVVLLDPRFDQAEQGQIYVAREVTILRPALRRRLFFVLLSPSLRTMDAHTAFLNNVNAIVNVNEVAELPRIIEQRLREFNELYKDFNQSMNVPAL
jgi:predicted Zn finger-like uncharacterized protein